MVIKIIAAVVLGLVCLISGVAALFTGYVAAGLKNEDVAPRLWSLTIALALAFAWSLIFLLALAFP